MADLELNALNLIGDLGFDGSMGGGAAARETHGVGKSNLWARRPP